MEENESQPIRCLVIPADPGFLVVPSAAVAEVVPLAIDGEQSYERLLGHMEWRGLTVPVYSMEALRGEAVPDFGKRSKACVFYPWKGADNKQFFAIATRYDPRPRTLTSEDIAATDEPEDNDFVSASFRYDGEQALVPNLKAIANQASS
jgi:chemosensory pili system protein ChpC